MSGHSIARFQASGMGYGILRIKRGMLLWWRYIKRYPWRWRGQRWEGGQDDSARDSGVNPPEHHTLWNLWQLAKKTAMAEHGIVGRRILLARSPKSTHPIRHLQGRFYSSQIPKSDCRRTRDEDKIGGYPYHTLGLVKNISTHSPFPIKRIKKLS